MNTMKDLKERVLEELQHLDGCYFESLSTVSLYHMLGIIDSGEEDIDKKIEGTFLDPEDPFWVNYARGPFGWEEIHREIEIALRLLCDEGRIRLIEPQDQDFSGVYVEIDSSMLDREWNLDIQPWSSNLALQVTTNGETYQTVLTKQ